MPGFDRLLEPGRLMSGVLVESLLRERLAMIELLPGQPLGPFCIRRELGRGGMGIVYLAVRADGAYEQEVAIKWLPVCKAATTFVEQFRRERQILANLRHPHIARLMDGGCSEDGHLWFAMEHVDGPRVDQYVAEAGLGWRKRVELLLPVVEAVQFAHTRLLVHRDIKPGNVLVDAEGRAILVDFGIAALLCEVNALGAYTAGCASPEQRSGAPPDITADVWQLGQLLRQVLAVAVPGQPQPVLPRDLRAVLDRATDAIPGRRYPAAASLHCDLQRVLAHRPVTARPPGLWHRLNLLRQCHPWGMTASAVAIALFLATVAIFMVRLTHQRNVSEHARQVAESVNAFLEDDFLPGADPLQSGSGKVTVAEVAERALSRVEPRLHAVPEVAAEVEMSLGRTLANLGHFGKAEQAFDQAIKHLVFLYGSDDVRVLRARLQRAKYSIDPKHLTTIESHLQQLRGTVLQSREAHPELLHDVDAMLARAAFLRGDFSLCKKRYQTLLPHLAHAGSVTRSNAYMGLSLCEARLGQGGSALRNARTSLALVQSTLGPSHPYTLESKLALETALMSMGHYDQAVAVLRKLVVVLRKRYGGDHPVTLNAVHDLGFALVCAGHPEIGANWLEQAVRLRARVLGPDHPWTAMSESVLAMALIHQDKTKQAAGMLDQARAALGTRAAATPYVQMVFLENTADLALLQGHASKALGDYDNAIKVARTLYPAGHPRLAVLQLGRGMALVRDGQAGAGRKQLRTALKRLGTHPDCRPRQRRQARQLLVTR